jgi:hypothetical protein
MIGIPSISKWTLAAVVALASMIVLGCNSLEPPNFAHPGPAFEQRARAEQYDPFPEVDTAPAVEARPREYTQPMPEPSRAQWHPWGWTGR